MAKLSTAIIMTVCASVWLHRASAAYVVYEADKSPDKNDVASISTTDVEYFSRLDVIPCSGARVPGLNQLRIHFTEIYSDGFPRCKVKRTFIRRITVGSANVKYFSSPRRRGARKYANNRLVYYNLGCPDNTQMSLMIGKFDLQEKVHYSQGNMEERLCVDYVNITAPGLAPVVMCGKKLAHQPIHITGNTALVTFRTSTKEIHTGFSMVAICRNSSTANSLSCNEEEESASIEHNTEELLHLYKTYLTGAHLLSDWHYRKMKRLAVACGDSCDSLARAVGEEVLEETAT